MKFKTFILIFGIALSLTACQKSNTADQDPLTLLNVDTDGTSSIAAGNTAPIFVSTAALTSEEIEFLYAIREDEKMARDLYNSYGQWHQQIPQIQRIARAEASHMACIEAVLNYYEIDYPSLSAPGVFNDPERQNLYNHYLEMGSDLIQALNIMASLEEETILAFNGTQPWLSNSNLIIVVSNLTRASCNHLKATVRQLEHRDIDYAPKFLDPSTFEAIMTSDYQCGKAYGRHGKAGQCTNAQKGGQRGGCKGSVNANGDCTGTQNNGKPQGGSGGGRGYRGGRH